MIRHEPDGGTGGAGERSFLGGRVVLRTLPVWEVGTPGTPPSLKRVRLPQGEIAQVLQGDPGARYLAWLELRAGCPRGNHVHRRKEEFYYQVAGDVEWMVLDPETGERATFGMVPGDLLRVGAGIAHVVLPRMDGQALEFSPESLDPSDTIRVELVPPRSAGG